MPDAKSSAGSGRSTGAAPEYLVLEASPNAIIAIDAQGRIAYANPRVMATFGYGVDELLGQPVELLLPERVRHQHVLRALGVEFAQGYLFGRPEPFA